MFTKFLVPEKFLEKKYFLHFLFSKKSFKKNIFFIFYFCENIYNYIHFSRISNQNTVLLHIFGFYPVSIRLKNFREFWIRGSEQYHQNI